MILFLLKGYPYLEIRYIRNGTLRKQYTWGNRKRSEFPPDWIQSEDISICKRASLKCKVSNDAEKLKQQRLTLLANAATLQWLPKHNVSVDREDEDDEL